MLKFGTCIIVVHTGAQSDGYIYDTIRYDTIRYDTIGRLTCAQKMKGWPAKSSARPRNEKNKEKNIIKTE